MNEIQIAHKTLGSLFSNDRSVPSVQKVHSTTAVDINKLECKFYANSRQKLMFNFKFNFSICIVFLSYTVLEKVV